MTPEAFDRWLVAYGSAWEARDAGKFSAIFTDDVRYYWTPFGPPKEGREGVAAAFSGAVENQRNIRFRHEILTASETRCVARWWCELERPTTGRQVRLEGILMIVPTSDGLSAEFREWWHSEEQSG